MNPLKSAPETWTWTRSQSFRNSNVLTHSKNDLQFIKCCLLMVESWKSDCETICIQISLLQDGLKRNQASESRLIQQWIQTEWILCWKSQMNWWGFQQICCGDPQGSGLNKSLHFYADDSQLCSSDVSAWFHLSLIFTFTFTPPSRGFGAPCSQSERSALCCHGII